MIGLLITADHFIYHTKIFNKYIMRPDFPTPGRLDIETLSFVLWSKSAMPMNLLQECDTAVMN